MGIVPKSPIAKMYTVMERYMVQQLKQAGITAAKIEEITGMSESTIRRISQETPIAESDESPFRKSRKLGRPSSVAAYTEQISAWLREERSAEDGPMKSTEVLARLRQMGYTGGKSAVFELVRHLQPPPLIVPIVRFVGVACRRHRDCRGNFLNMILVNAGCNMPMVGWTSCIFSPPG